MNYGYIQIGTRMVYVQLYSRVRVSMAGWRFVVPTLRVGLRPWSAFPGGKEGFGDRDVTFKVWGQLWSVLQPGANAAPLASNVVTVSATKGALLTLPRPPAAMANDLDGNGTVPIAPPSSIDATF